MKKTEYPLETVREYRRKLDAGDFRRSILEREIYDLDTDRVKLECGHLKLVDYTLSQALGKDTRLRCSECIDEWLKTKEGPNA